MPPKVDFQHPAYVAHLSAWTLIDHCVKSTVKDHGDRYLLRPNPTDTSDANRARYAQYLERALFYNFCGRTLAGMVGQVYAKPPTIETAKALSVVVSDADGAGVSLLQQSRFSLSLALSKGRAGLFVDYPETEGPASRQDQLDGLIRANILLYEPESVINWRLSRVGAQNVLTLVVIRESYNAIEDADPYAYKTRPQLRVLRLVDEVYRQEIWRANAAEDAMEMVETFVPVDSDGQTLPYIPFTFIGWDNNDPDPDSPPLLDLANLNIAHYRNSADYEEMLYMVGQDTPVFTGLTKEWVDDVLEGVVQLGSRAAVPLPVGANATLLSVSGSPMPMEGMMHKEKQAVAIGARLVEPRAVAQTATEASLKSASEVSILSSAVHNVSEAYNQALEWVVAFMGVDDGFTFLIDGDFDARKLSAQDAQALLAMWQGEGISYEEYRTNLKAANIAFLEDDVAKAQIASENPLPGDGTAE